MTLLTRAALVLTVLAVVEAAAGAETRVGLLPVRGSRAAADRLGGPLGSALASRGLTVVGIEELQRTLTGAPEVARALKSARAAIEEAERHALYMKRADALAAAGRARAELRAVAARHHAPTLVARALVALALARLLKPPDEEGALSALRTALASDPGYAPNPDRLPSRAARLLQRAREARDPPSPPSLGELATLAPLAKVGRVIWIAVIAHPDRADVTLLVYDHEKRSVVTRYNGRLPKDGLARRIAALVEPPLERSSPPRQLTAVAPAWTSAPDDGAPRAERRSRPWYKRWWVWTLAGAVVVATGVAVAVTATSSTSDRTYEFHVTHGP
jgi:hypothetical protein